ncbi:MAG: chemotaxis protein CheR, partial [Cyanobacteria bacterium REEB65]|nr:chemotaxis protein CheR [Cyanobacteria bacterium REEB65]
MASSAHDRDALGAFKLAVSPWIGVDLTAYKDRQMERRILALMNRSGAPDLGAYLDMLRADPERLREFLLGLTINVSEWFRNGERFEELRQFVLPELLSRHD